MPTSIHHIDEITEQTYTRIHACNLALVDHNKLFAPLVLLSQKACDNILQDNNKSTLEKIFLCAKEAEKFEAGNCLIKCYVEFTNLLKRFVQQGINTYDKCMPISIYTSTNHAILIIDNILVADPSFNVVMPLVQYKNQYARYSRPLKEYFGIQSNWECYIKKIYPDEKSTQFTMTLFDPPQDQINKWGNNNPSKSLSCGC